MHLIVDYGDEMITLRESKHNEKRNGEDRMINP